MKTKFDAQSIDDILNGLKTDKNGRIRGKNRVIDQLQSLHLQSIELEQEPPEKIEEEMNSTISELKKDFSGSKDYLSGVNDGMYYLFRKYLIEKTI